MSVGEQDDMRASHFRKLSDIQAVLYTSKITTGFIRILFFVLSGDGEPNHFEKQSDL